MVYQIIDLTFQSKFEATEIRSSLWIRAAARNFEKFHEKFQFQAIPSPVCVNNEAKNPWNRPTVLKKTPISSVNFDVQLQPADKFGNCRGIWVPKFSRFSTICIRR